MSEFTRNTVDESSVCDTTPKEPESEGPLESFHSIRDREQLEVDARAAVLELLSTKGNTFVQGLLQAEIQRVKKLESNVASIKKKITAISKAVDELNASILREAVNKEKKEKKCLFFREEIERRGATAVRAAKAMEAYRNSIMEKYTKKFDEIRAESDEHKQHAVELMEENRRLTEEVAQRKKEFDESSSSYESDCARRQEYVESIIRSYRQAANDVETLEARLTTARQERQALEERKASLEEKVMRCSEAVPNLEGLNFVETSEQEAKKNYEETETRISQLEEEKRDITYTRIALDKETVSWRAALASHKRELHRLEKSKFAAENKCRQAQQKAGQKGAESKAGGEA
ncbi:unnamed protein product [Trypanosoma congolense IL3000]|uniref:WGS project CAEQ00000000 data, annotated contig 1314 n=1 Tax=Trypanosoma congolense (strain IL3000) TaxID=1068625 RepID=F9W5D2_TRYCI|nr:unnamed protein product [Trypanosoma congolense IL3000]